MRRRYDQPTYGQTVKALAKANGKDILPDIKLPRKKRKKELLPRKEYNREEDIIRKEIISALRKKGVKVMRIENSISGKNNTGIADLWIFDSNRKLAGWIEVKSHTGKLTGNQPEFQNNCKMCGINYWVVRTVEEALNILLTTT